MEQNLEKTVNPAKESNESLLARLFGRGWTIEKKRKKGKGGRSLPNYQIHDIIEDVQLVSLQIGKARSEDEKMELLELAMERSQYIPLGISDLHWLMENPEFFPEEWKLCKEVRFYGDIISNQVGQFCVIFAFWSKVSESQGKWRWGVAQLTLGHEEISAAVLKKTNSHKRVA